MNNWSSRHYELQHRRSRDYSPKPRSERLDRSRFRPRMLSQAGRRQRYDGGSLASKRRAMDDIDDRNLQIPDFSRKLPRHQMPDIITSNTVGSSMEKSFEKGYSRTEFRSHAAQGDVDSYELYYADCRFRRDR